MIKELCNKIIYNDFIKETILTEEEKNILDMWLLRYSIVKIAEKSGMSDRNVSRVLKEIREKYDNFRKIELAKLGIFNS